MCISQWDGNLNASTENVRKQICLYIPANRLTFKKDAKLLFSLLRHIRHLHLRE